ncbi:hypothetical protein Tco_1322552, partial [Tanacetum coccineum]
METCDPVDTRTMEKSKLDEDPQGKAVDPTHYRGMIGTLVYLTSSRLNLVFDVCMRARCPYGELDGVVTPPDELVNISGPSGELDGAPTLPDGRDTTKTVETNLVILRRPWFHAILDLTSVLTTSLLL